MRIGFDARIASYNNSGLKRYLLGLQHALLDSSLANNSDTFLLYQSWRSRNALIQHPRVSYRKLFTPAHSAFERVTLPFELYSKEVDLIHCVDFFAPFGKRVPLIATAQDLYFLKDPSCMSKDSFNHYRKFRGWAEKAAHVICSSQSTLNDLLALTNVTQKKASVVYPGIDPKVFDIKVDVAEDTRRRFGIKEAPILFVGTIEPRKNILRMLDGYDLAREKLRDKIPPLVIIGRKGFGSDQILPRIERGKGRIFYLGELTDGDLFALYKSAAFLLYPSLYEGFGFPIVEAFASGIPVVTSNCSCMPEVAGDAAQLVDPNDIESIAQGILTMVSDDAKRKELVRLGTKRLAQFSWRAAAEKIRAIYAEVGTRR